MLGSIVDLAKRIPLDLGQGNLRFVTMGKVIAQSLVPVPASLGATALDVGCREGAQSRWLEARGYRVTSIDVEKVYDKAQVVDANEPLPFSDGSFDLLWSSEVIEHLSDPSASLKEFRRVVKPGGTLVLTTPNSSAWFFRALGYLGLPPSRLQHAGHQQFFSLRDIQQLFPTAEISGYFPYLLAKRKIETGLNLLTPTFVIRELRPG